QDDLDAAYVKNFGHSVILVSDKGIPARAKCDMSQFDYRDGKFFIQSGPEANFAFRALLPGGTTLGAELEKVKKEQAANLQYHTEDLCVYKVWSSNDEGGTPVENVVWPTSLKETPKWASSKDGYTSLEPSVYSWIAPGVSWDGDFKSTYFGLMFTSKPGQKLYVTFHVGFEYKTPAGAVETKWNDVLQKWENVTSNGLSGYALSEPLAASTIEFK
ncbi:MAG: hypothetical protein AB1403_10365, partial [Candidatus Riflebacteria bacterium]